MYQWAVYFSGFQGIRLSLGCAATPAYIIFQIHDDGPEGQGPLCSWARSQCPNSSWQERRSARVLFFVVTQTRGSLQCGVRVAFRQVVSEEILPHLDRFPDQITLRPLRSSISWCWKVKHPVHLLSLIILLLHYWTNHSSFCIDLSPTEILRKILQDDAE